MAVAHDIVTISNNHFQQLLVSWKQVSGVTQDLPSETANDNRSQYQ